MQIAWCSKNIFQKVYSVLQAVEIHLINTKYCCFLNRLQRFSRAEQDSDKAKISTAHISLQMVFGF